MAGGELLCDLKNITKNFLLPSGSNMTVLEKISLEVRAEEVLAVLGPSGCGKSTLMRILAGLITPEGGQVMYHGKPLTGRNPGVAIVFQSFALYPWLTVVQNIFEPLRSRGLDGAAAMAAAEKVIHLVGLGGFEDAYPRELSGGMKQRVGIARALAVEPEILCMDEPFSQVDALTAENLRSEVVKFWSDRSTNPKTIFMVSHDVKEVVVMATRIVVLGTRPSQVRKIFENDLPYPRDYRSPAFQKLVDQIHAVITSSEIPDEPPVASITSNRRSAMWEPLPDANASEIFGLMEVLEDLGGKTNVFSLVDRLGREFGKILNVVKATELLDLADTPKQDVVLTDIGRRWLAASVPERKEIFRVQVESLRLFSDLVQQLGRADRHELDTYDVMSELALNLPYEDVEKLLETLVNWARNADLFDYDPERERIFIREEETEDQTPPPPPEAPAAE